MSRLRSYSFMAVMLLLVDSLSAQKNYTLTYKFVFASNDTLSVVWGSKIKLLVQDSLSFTCHSEIIDSLAIGAENPIGQTHFAKVTYCVSKKEMRITPLGRISHPKEWKLGVQKNDRGKWKIEEEQKIIAGFPCTKATGVINNRSCTAWFNTAFPGGYGPNILTSLPGAIFEIRYDDTGSLLTVVETADSVLPLTEPVYCKRVKLR